MGLIGRLLIFLFIILILGFFAFFLPNITGRFSLLIENSEKLSLKEQGFVSRVVDGDTIHVNVNGEDEIIRFLGVNTPEKKKDYYNEAKDFLINEIENKSIELVSDGSDKDRYGRRLRYIFYHDRLINVEIIEKGLATTFMLDDLKYKDKFVIGESFAKNNGVGLWEKSKEQCAFCINLIELEPNVDYFIIRNNCEFKCELNNWEVKDDANHFFKLQPIEGRESRKYDSLEIFKSEVWNDNHDRFFMRDSNGKLVIFYFY